MEKDRLFFVDAETDGLNGNYISIAIIVTDLDCIEQERYYYGIDKNRLCVSDEWTKKNVIPIMGSYAEKADEQELLESFWSVWMKYRDRAYAIGDVIYPVEARLFQRCVYKDVNDRGYYGPFPFIDLSSILFAHNIDPLSEREQLTSKEFKNESIQHNALYDVEMTIDIYKNLMRKS
jgi:hypothetical protein